MTHPPKHERPADRVSYIAALMRARQWKTGRTGRELSELWGLALSTLDNYATEASRRVMAEVNNPEAVSASLGVAFEAAVDEALEDSRDSEISNRNQSRHALVALGKAWSELAGASAPARVQVEVSVSELTPEALRLETVEAMRVLAQADPTLLLEIGKADDHGNEEK